MIYYSDLDNMPCLLAKNYSEKREGNYYLGRVTNYSKIIVDGTFKATSKEQIENFVEFYRDSIHNGADTFEIDILTTGVLTKTKARFIDDISATYTNNRVADFKVRMEVVKDIIVINAFYDGTLSVDASTKERYLVDVGPSPKLNGVVYSGRHIYLDDTVPMYVDYPVNAETQSIILYDVNAKEFELITSFTTSTYHRVDKSHSHVYIIDAAVTTEDMEYLNIYPESLVKWFYFNAERGDEGYNPFSFWKTSVQGFYIGSEFDGDKVYDVTDETNSTYATIISYNSACRTTYQNVSFGPQTLKYICGENGVVFDYGSGMLFESGSYVSLPTSPNSSIAPSKSIHTITISLNEISIVYVSSSNEIYVVSDNGSVSIADNGDEVEPD